MEDGSTMFCALACNVVLMNGSNLGEAPVVWPINAVLDTLGSMGNVSPINVNVGKIS